MPLAYQSSTCQRQPCIGLQEPMAQASRLLDVPRFSPYHPVRRQHTSQDSHRQQWIVWLRKNVCLQQVSGTGSTDQDRADWGVLCLVIGVPEFAPLQCRAGACMPVFNSCQQQSTVVWWWGRKRSAGSLGDESCMWHSFVRPRYKPGVGGLIRLRPVLLVRSVQ